MYKILAIPLLFGGIFITSEYSTGVQQNSIDEQVQITTFNKVIKNNLATGSTDISTYCLGIKTPEGIKDPNQPLLRGIVHPTAISIQPYSVCHIEQSSLVKSNGKKAIAFFVDKPQCQASQNCTIRGGYYEGNLSAQTNMYKAELVDKKWIVALISEGPVS
jgi:hypothetical protein